MRHRHTGQNYLLNRRAGSRLRGLEGVATSMRYEHPIKQILLDNRHLWDHPQTRPAAREDFQRDLDCRTPALGAEVYGPATEEKLELHTCTSRTGPR